MTEPSQYPALLVRANFGELTLNNYPQFQGRVRLLVRTCVAYEVAREMDPVEGGLFDDLPEPPIRITASISANPWIEVFEVSRLAMGGVGALVGIGLARAGSIMDTVARIRTFGPEVRARKAEFEADAEESEARRLRALAEQHRSREEIAAADRADSVARAIDGFSEFTVNSVNFSASQIPASTASQIQSATVDLANYATWIGAESNVRRPD